MTRSPSTVTPRTWLVAPLAADVRRSIDRLAGSADVRQVAVMPDVHRSGDVCVGVAVATSGLVYPAAVGGDIGCGMAALRFDAAADILAAEATAIEILRGFRGAVPALKRRRADAMGGPTRSASRPRPSRAPRGGTARGSSARSAAAITSSSCRPTRRGACG